MPRHPFLLLLLLAPAAVRADEGQKKVIAAASPSIARIYVSRSTAYATAPHWGVVPKQEWPGQLGRFDAAAAAKRVPAAAPNRARILRTIREHDLSAATHVPESYGSGFVVDRGGLVLTNAHVVKNAVRIYVRLPGKRGSWADVWACDSRSDLAVLKLLDPPAGLKALALGDGDKVRQGDKVLCLANEFAPGFKASDAPTLWSGSIIALRRRLVKKTSEVERARYPLHHLGNLLQTDGAITPSCSGGVLLDPQGKVVGLTSATAAVGGERRGAFAIPLDTNTRRVIDALKKGAEVEYGFLGIVLERDEDAVGNGVTLYRVSPGTPAWRAKLQPGDRILKIDGKAVRNNDDLFLFIGMALAGNTARLVVQRGRNEVNVDVTLAKYYVPGTVIAAKQPPARFGLRVDWTSVLFVRNPFPFSTRVPATGVAIREVVSGSAADKARLQPDKIITRVNGKQVATPAEYYREVAKAGKKVELTYRTSDNRDATVTLEEK